MRICLLSPEPLAAGGPAHSVRDLAALLADRHEVTVIRSGRHGGSPAVDPAASFREVVAEPEGEVLELSFSCEDHRHSAAVMAAIRSVYGDRGPDYLEVPDFRAQALVPLQARRAGDPVLASTTIGVRASPSLELANLHDEQPTDAFGTRLAQLEREQLRLADRLLWAGGDVLGVYRRYYGTSALPEPVRIRPPIGAATDLGAAKSRGDGPLRILYVGDLRRRAGAIDLAEACKGLADDEWELTMIGADSPTAGMGQSVRLTIEAMGADDPRIRIEEELDWERLRTRLGEFDLLVAPARVDAFAATSLEAMRAGLPVLATPVGDQVEVVADGVTGWHAADVRSLALRRALTKLLDDPGEVERVRESGEIANRARALTDPEALLAEYDRLLGTGTRRVPTPAAPAGPLVTGVVPYFRASAYVSKAVESLLDQTHRNLDVVIVNDGSFFAADSVLAELEQDPRVRVVTQLNGGESSARDLGVLVAEGEYVVMLDADNMLEPTFVERALALFEREPDLAYVTCWLRMVDGDGADTDLHPGFAPLGNRVLAEMKENWDGDTLALLPRRIFSELGFDYDPEGSMHSDWELYRCLRAEGHFGAVIPERLARYRVLPDSLMRAYAIELQDRGWAESRPRATLRRTRWTAEAEL